MTYLQINGNKYRADSNRYNNYVYQSGMEAAYAKELDERLAKKEIKGWLSLPFVVIGGFILFLGLLISGNEW